MRNMGWAIKGKNGFYVGWWLTRSEAIVQHCKDLGKTWQECRRKGDRAVKVRIVEIG